MKYKVDEWVIFDPWKANSTLSNPQRAVILYVFKENERSIYDYEIYIDSANGRYKKVKEADLYPASQEN